MARKPRGRSRERAETDDSLRTGRKNGDPARRGERAGAVDALARRISLQ